MKNPSMTDQVLAIREGGFVERLHTVPHIGPASVAAHSWNMATMLLLLFPDASKELMKAVLLHDVAERWVGDTPAPCKYTMNPGVGQALKLAEELVEHHMPVLKVDLTDEERHILKGLDILDLWLYCNDQSALGNSNLNLTQHNCELMLDSDWIPGPIRDFMTYGDKCRRTDFMPGEVMRKLKHSEVTDG